MFFFIPFILIYVMRILDIVKTWVLLVDVPELENMREKAGLTRKIGPHPFFIKLAEGQIVPTTRKAIIELLKQNGAMSSKQLLDQLIEQGHTTQLKYDEKMLSLEKILALLEEKRVIRKNGHESPVTYFYAQPIEYPESHYDNIDAYSDFP